MDFVNLISATFVLTLFENLTVGHTYQGSGTFEIVPKNDKSERKRFLVTKQNAAWNGWSQWSVCSSSCREGVQARGRACNTGVTSDCTGQNFDVMQCNLGPCSVWNPWSPWSVCSHTCGDGLRARGRSCESGVLSDCDGPHYENDNCTLKSCSAWTPWSSWSVCSHNCGGGFQTRDRMCNTGVNSDCEGHSYDVRDCNAVPCNATATSMKTPEPTGDGSWSAWSEWTVCTATCGSGTHNRNRTCLYPPHLAHGHICSGPSNQTDNCNTNFCPLDGNLGLWNSWSRCSRSCGNGTITRSRECQFNVQYPRGKNCTAPLQETSSCYTGLCPVDGTWSSWKSWDSCSKSCENGTQSRSRTCEYPDGVPHGNNCHENSHENRTCNPSPCPVDGAWDPWSKWTSCATTCGTGVQYKRRKCSFPIGVPHGSNCTGQDTVQQNCSTNLCPKDGVWGEWEAWSSCSKSCGNGTQSRSRLCRFDSAVPQGKVCDGDTKESKFCNTVSCPITCATCGDNPPDLCELIYEQNTVCPDPYCVNIVRNPESGQRLLERKCGSLQECKVDWWQQTSQDENCTLFNENFIYTQSFECTYCCTTANCNNKLHPDTSSLYKEN